MTEKAFKVLRLLKILFLQLCYLSMEFHEKGSCQKMKEICFIKMTLLLLGVMFLSGGCACISGPSPERPLPAGDPYSVPSSGTKRSESVSAREERLINEAVSAISLRMALSTEGPYRILWGKKPSVLVERILHSLASMGLIQPRAEHTLLLAEEEREKVIRLRLTVSGSGRIFFEYDIPKQEKQK